ncbi:MAG: PLP-dependent aminotransferase family protein [Polyangiaceae bacterium]
MRTTGLTLDATSSEPLYKQIFDQIVARIRSRAFPAGHRLPPTRALAEELATHRNTVVRAYSDLESAGFVTSAVGRGTFVAVQAEPAPAAPLPQTGSLPWASLLSSAADAEPLRRTQRFGGRQAGRDLVNLTNMQPSPDLIPDDLLRRCAEHVLRTEGAKALAYAPPEGLPRLRALVAEELSRSGVPVTDSDVVITTGSQQGLDLVARALVTPGDVFLVDPMTYTGAINLLTLAGARLVPVPSDSEGPDLMSLSRYRGPGVKGLYLMPNCRNPTGECVSAARRRALSAWSRETGIPLIEDDYGADLALSGGPAPPALRALDGEVLHLGTFSKKLAPALRVGFLVAPPEVRRALVAVKRAMDLGTSAFLQLVLAEFLERGYLRAHLRKTLPEYKARRDALDKALREHAPPEMKWTVPERGVVLWLPLPRGLDAERVFDEAARRGVLVSPGTVFGVESRPVPGIRLTFCGESEKRVAEGGKRLGAALTSLLAGPLRAGDGASISPV